MPLNGDQPALADGFQHAGGLPSLHHRHSGGIFASLRQVSGHAAGHGANTGLEEGVGGFAHAQGGQFFQGFRCHGGVAQGDVFGDFFIACKGGVLY